MTKVHLIFGESVRNTNFKTQPNNFCKHTSFTFPCYTYNWDSYAWKGTDSFVENLEAEIFLLLNNFNFSGDFPGYFLQLGVSGLLFSKKNISRHVFVKHAEFAPEELTIQSLIPKELTVWCEFQKVTSKKFGFRELNQILYQLVLHKEMRVPNTDTILKHQ